MTSKQPPKIRRTRHAGNAPHAAKRKQAQALRDKGLSFGQIAAICGVSRQAIHQLLKRANAAPRT